MTNRKTTRRPDGRLERQITLYDGITGKSYRRHVYAKTELELINKVNKLMAMYSGLSQNRYTVASFIDYYMEARHENDPGTSTLDTYDHLVRNYIAGTDFAAMKIDTVNVPACRQFLRNFVPKANVSGTRTKQLLYVFLHTVFEQAWHEKVIKENPFDFIDKPRHQSVERLSLTREEFEALLSVTKSEQMQRLFIFARNSGLRRGEVCGLQEQDLFLDAGFVAVRRAVKMHNKQWIIGEPKNRYSKRTVAIPPVIVDLLREQLEFNKAQNRRTGHDAFVFQGADGEYLAPSSLSRAFCEARKELGLPREMTFHSLRATVATYLAEHDVNPKKIQARLGHSTIAMTMNRYVKQTPTMQSSILGLLNDM